MTEIRYNGTNEGTFRHTYTIIPAYICVWKQTHIHNTYIKLEKENTRLLRVGYCSVAVICNFSFALFSTLLVLSNENDHLQNQKEKQAFFKCRRSD